MERALDLWSSVQVPLSEYADEFISHLGVNLRNLIGLDKSHLDQPKDLRPITFDLIQGGLGILSQVGTVKLAPFIDRPANGFGPSSFRTITAPSLASVATGRYAVHQPSLDTTWLAIPLRNDTAPLRPVKETVCKLKDTLWRYNPGRVLDSVAFAAELGTFSRHRSIEIHQHVSSPTVFLRGVLVESRLIDEKPQSSSGLANKALDPKQIIEAARDRELGVHFQPTFELQQPQPHRIQGQTDLEIASRIYWCREGGDLSRKEEKALWEADSECFKLMGKLSPSDVSLVPVKDYPANIEDWYWGRIQFEDFPFALYKAIMKAKHVLRIPEFSPRSIDPRTGEMLPATVEARFSRSIPNAYRPYFIKYLHHVDTLHWVGRKRKRPEIPEKRLRKRELEWSALQAIGEEIGKMDRNAIADQGLEVSNDHEIVYANLPGYEDLLAQYWERQGVDCYNVGSVKDFHWERNRKQLDETQQLSDAEEYWLNYGSSESPVFFQGTRGTDFDGPNEIPVQTMETPPICHWYPHFWLRMQAQKDYEDYENHAPPLVMVHRQIELPQPNSLDRPLIEFGDSYENNHYPNWSDYESFQSFERFQRYRKMQKVGPQDQNGNPYQSKRGQGIAPVVPSGFEQHHVYGQQAQSKEHQGDASRRVGGDYKAKKSRLADLLKDSTADFDGSYLRKRKHQPIGARGTGRKSWDSGYKSGTPS
ncbi:hypothetical protein BCR34DRAFT_598994 [Clohesyomyces aquaticus]|uniref:Uncharacterized protein n=1 Tax=Clohesyomyces aquaticus TaxID=1231657 RepID=A0A1Y1ZWM8_9PLEO|nr:hypothetical protein BCR34DRAFT_598994 [Clohesyomyces aquaticus]